jgi:hypothetical protein
VKLDGVDDVMFVFGRWKFLRLYVNGDLAECKSGYCCLCSVLANPMMDLDERCVLTVVFAMDMISSAFDLRCDGAAM